MSETLTTEEYEIIQAAKHLVGKPVDLTWGQIQEMLPDEPFLSDVIRRVGTAIKKKIIISINGIYYFDSSRTDPGLCNCEQESISPEELLIGARIVYKTCIDCDRCYECRETIKPQEVTNRGIELERFLCSWCNHR